MFLPQRPYLSIGTLRDQVIYPDGHHDMREKRKSEDDLKRILEDARLGYLPDREGGWDTRKEWKDVLSGGEKQRMGFARVLYHEPQFAILDEGTSAVSQDVEGLLYEVCKEKGISKLKNHSMSYRFSDMTQLSSPFLHAPHSRSITRTTSFSEAENVAMSGSLKESEQNMRRCRSRRSSRIFVNALNRSKIGRQDARKSRKSFLRCGWLAETS